MKKTIVFGVIGILFVSLLISASVPVLAGDTLYGKIYPSIELSLKDSVTIGQYTIKFVDTDRYFTTAVLVVSGPEGTKQIFVSEGSRGYYPSQSDPVIVFNVAIWNKDGTPVAYIDIYSPLKKVNANPIVLNVGNTYNLPVGKIKVYSLSQNSAKFQVYLPDNSVKSLTVNVNKTGSVVYSFPTTNFKYSNFVCISVKSVSKNSVTFDVYMPKVIATRITINKKTNGSSNSSRENGSQTPQITPIYNGLLYTGESLPVRINNTEYHIKLVSVVPSKVSVKVYKGKTSLGIFFVSVGTFQVLKNTPFKILVQKTEPVYDRASLIIYGPVEAQVTPILRSAKVVANITAVPKKVLLGQDIVLSIGVENLGRGDAYQLNVAAPIPNGFQLVSMTKSWQIKTLPAFTKLPMLVYVLRPTEVGKFDIGKVLVTYYDDQSLVTGKIKTIYSAPLTDIEVYAIPGLSLNASAYNGTWSTYVTAKVNSTVTLALTVRASKGNPDYEFIKNATLVLTYPKSLKGQTVLNLGTIKAGDVKTLKVPLQVLGENLSLVKATLKYLDPLGNSHEVNFGTIVTVNSIPPEVVIEKVKVWPKPEELPAYINQTLAKMDNATPLAEEILSVASAYVPPKKESNPWKPLAILFILATLVLAGVTYNYWRELETLKEKVLRKKQRRPGGLPKKEEENEIELL